MYNAIVILKQKINYMSIQFVSDNSGEKTAVLISITDWNRIVDAHPDIKDEMNSDLPQWQKEIINKRMILVQQHPEQVIGIEDFLKELEMTNNEEI